MGGCRCSYKTCKNTTKTTDNIHFFHYPVKQKDRCRIWIENAEKPNFCDLEEEQLRNKVICELHFEDKCFPNSQKKRLLQAAIPTLDNECEVLFENPIAVSTELQDVQVLPANEDGTIFVLDTDSMFNRVVSSQKVESYIYKNGTIFPKNNSNNSDIFYSLNMDCDASSKAEYIEDNQMNYMVFEPELDIRSAMKGSCEIIEHHKINLEENKEFVKYIPSPSPPQQQKRQIVEESRTVSPVEKRHSRQRSVKNIVSKSALERNYLRKIKQHSREIATIKRMLKQKNISEKPDHTSILNTLKSQLPPTLFTVLNLSLNNNCELSDDDINFFSTIQTTSPAVYKLLMDKFHWNIPNSDFIDTFTKHEISQP